jgi:hypothetical protein
MLTPEEESYILTNAYVPEHTVGLMTSLSGGEPFLIDDHFCCCKDKWVIFVGYPLRHPFGAANFEAVLAKIQKKFNPGRLSLIAPQVPPHLTVDCRESDSDYYYTLETRNPVIRSSVKRNLRKAAGQLTVERAARMGAAHQELMREFMRNVSPPTRVKALLFSMPQYVGATPRSFVLNAWCAGDKLAAFYVVDFTAQNFGNYIIGCFSRKNYVRGASDLLLMELIKLSLENAKGYIHLGLGVGSGIRRFKEKWGARPTRRYEMCELVFKKRIILEAIREMMTKFQSSGTSGLGD